MSIAIHRGATPPQESEIGDLWLETTPPFHHNLRVKCATEWVAIATLSVRSEPHAALFHRIMVESDA